MGTSSAREEIESKMLKLKLRRIEIKQERSERIKQLEKITGREIVREPIPDYVDHSEDEINPEDIESEDNEEKEEVKKKSKKTKKNKKSKKKEEEDSSDSDYEEKVKKKSKKKKKDKNRHQITKP